MHAFRAFAILNIVAIHALAGWLYFSGPVVLADSTLESISRLVELLFHESTIYFALISGLLYSLVLHRRGVASFARGKALNVLVPYALLTALFTALDWNPTQGWLLGIAPIPGDQSPQGYPVTLLFNLVSGQAIFVYWYIPVILLLFVFTPSLHRLLASRFGPVALVLMLGLPVVFSRTGIMASPSSLLYFLAPYALGLWLGQDYGARLTALARWRAGLMLLVFICSPLLYLFLEPGAQAPPPAFFSAIETLFYLQKTAFALWMLMALRGFDAGMPRAVHDLADMAFALYFLHVPVMLTVLPWALREVPAASPCGQHLGMMGLLFVVLPAGSWALVVGLRRVLGARSRWLVEA